MKRTVCFCNSNRAWGGGEKWHLEAALGLAKRGCEVFLMAGEGSVLLERARAYPAITTRAMRFSGLDFLNPFTLGACAAFFREHGVSRVVLGLPADLKTAGLAAKKAGVPGIFYRRGSALPVRNNFLNRYLYGKVLTGLIVNSEETARQVFSVNASLIARDKVHVLYNGLDTAAFDAALTAAAPAFRQEGDTLVIGNAGRLTTQKGQQYLLYMSRALLDAGVRHRLVIAGDGERGNELRELAARLDLADTVVFAGFLSDMAPFWRGIDIFVLSSLWEGFGYVLAEAQLAGKPVVAFNGNSMPEVVRPGETGTLLPLPAADEADERVGLRLAEAVRHLADNAGETRRMAEAGRAFCMKTFDQERCMDALHALLWPEDDNGR
ncbi:glycosyltransferase [Desulfovibrio sp. OttesenSCG-928-O18]|nr:glycosyltransferase [Desulfovibrio sp. OttesenSCG-928-O18]